MNMGMFDLTKRHEPSLTFPFLGKPRNIPSINDKILYDPRSIGGLQVWLDASDPLRIFDTTVQNGTHNLSANRYWRDLSGFNRNANLINGPSYSPLNRGVMNFDATDDYANIPINSTTFINTSFTWCVWILGIPSGSSTMPHIGYGSGAWPRLGFRYAPGNGGWFFSQYNNAGPPLTQDVFIGAGSSTSWSYLCASGDFTSRRVRTFRNGRLIGNGGWIDSTGNVGSLVLGRTSGSFPGYINGSIGEFKVFNRQLNVNEIFMDFEASRSRYNI